MRVYVYEITASKVDTVKVGSFIVDTEDGDREDWGDLRFWNLYNEETGSFEDGWTGVRLNRACTKCFKGHRKVSSHKHEGAHGESGKLVPTPSLRAAAIRAEKVGA